MMSLLLMMMTVRTLSILSLTARCLVQMVRLVMPRKALMQQCSAGLLCCRLTMLSPDGANGDAEEGSDAAMFGGASLLQTDDDDESNEEVEEEAVEDDEEAV